MSSIYDVAAFSGATVVSRDLGMTTDNVDPVQVVGRVSLATIKRDQTLLIGGHGCADARVTVLEHFMTDNPVLGEFDQEVISERISKLKGGVHIITPGGKSKVEV